MGLGLINAGCQVLGHCQFKQLVCVYWTNGKRAIEIVRVRF